MDSIPQPQGLMPFGLYPSYLEMSDPDPFLRLLVSPLSCCNSLHMGLSVSHCPCPYTPFLCCQRYLSARFHSLNFERAALHARLHLRPFTTRPNLFFHFHIAGVLTPPTSRHTNLFITLKNITPSTQNISESVARGGVWEKEVCVFYTLNICSYCFLCSMPFPAFSAHLQSPAHLSPLWSLL